MDARRKWAFGLVGAMGAAALVAAAGACGNSGASETFVGNGDSSSPAPVSDSGIPSLLDGAQPDVPIATGTLIIQPQNQTIDVPPSATLQFYAYEDTDPNPIPSTWSIDQQALGSIDDNGLFTASGTAGGTLNVYAQAGQAVGQTPLRDPHPRQRHPLGVRRRRSRCAPGRGHPPTRTSSGSIRTTRRCSRAASSRRACSGRGRSRSGST